MHPRARGPGQDALSDHPGAPAYCLLLERTGKSLPASVLRCSQIVAGFLRRPRGQRFSLPVVDVLCIVGLNRREKVGGCLGDPRPRQAMEHFFEMLHENTAREPTCTSCHPHGQKNPKKIPSGFSGSSQPWFPGHAPQLRSGEILLWSPRSFGAPL